MQTGVVQFSIYSYLHAAVINCGLIYVINVIALGTYDIVNSGLYKLDCFCLYLQLNRKRTKKLCQ